jgi:16S rRNA (uracil1498-N3)-methyltransferase
LSIENQEMHRFYLPPERCTAATLQLDGREAHHALHVLRLKSGDTVTVLDGAGNEFNCEVETGSHNSLALSVTGKNHVAPRPCSTTLLVALPRGKIIESIIQKSVELGVHRIVPLLTERVVIHLSENDRASKREKWQLVAIEAIKQCGAAWLPIIKTPMTPVQFLARSEKFDLSLVGSLQADRRDPRGCFREFKESNGGLPKNVAVWIGPEGDFTPDELKAVQVSGAQPITLGPLTLRVETAAVYCLSILNYELQAAP